MKVLKFNIEEASSPIKVDKYDVLEFVRDGNVEIVLNGIITHIIASAEYSRCDSDKLRNAVSSIISQLTEKCTSDKRCVEVAIDGTNTIRSEEDDDNNYIFQGFKITPYYEYE